MVTSFTAKSKEEFSAKRIVKFLEQSPAYGGIVSLPRTNSLYLYFVSEECWVEFMDMNMTNFMLRLADQNQIGMTYRKLKILLDDIRNETTDNTPVKTKDKHMDIFQQSDIFYSHIIPAKGRYIDVKNYKIIEPDPKYYKRYLVDIPVDDSDELGKFSCPKWLDTLSFLLDGNEQNINLIQEIFGYCLFSDYPLQNFFVLYGKGGTGKSIVAATLRMVLNGSLSDVNRTSSVSSSSFSNDIMIHAMVDKMANICEETPVFSDSISIERLKMICGGSPVTFNVKYESATTRILRAKLLFCCNEYPKFNEQHNEISRRLIVIPFEKSLLGTEYENKSVVKDWFLPEIKGIFFWMIEGARRLAENGAFTVSQDVKDASKEMIRSIDNVVQFIEEVFDKVWLSSPGDDKIFSVASSDIYGLYRIWCEDNGIRNTLKKIDLIRQVKSKGGFATLIPRIEGVKTRCLTGLKVKGEWNGRLAHAFHDSRQNSYPYHND